MLVTTNGAVPIATLDINCGAVILALANTCAVPKLSTLALPDTFAVPVMFAPVLVTTNLLAPVTAIATLALAVIDTLLLPFCIKLLLIVVILPVVILPVVKLAVVPTTLPNQVNPRTLPKLLYVTTSLAILTLLPKVNSLLPLSHPMNAVTGALV